MTRVQISVPALTCFSDAFRIHPHAKFRENCRRGAIYGELQAETTLCLETRPDSRNGPIEPFITVSVNVLAVTMTRIRDNIDMYHQMCVECGRCREVCLSYNRGGCDPLAVMRGDNSKVFDCIGCGYCSRACDHTDPKIVMLAAYSIMLNRPVSQAFLDTGYSRYPSEDAPGSDMKPVWDGEDVMIMPGCVAKCDVPYVVYAVSVALRGLGIHASELPGFTCCMYPIQFGTMEDDERWGYVRRMKEASGESELVTLCGGCHELMSEHGAANTHFIQLLHRNIDRLPRLERGLRVAIHPGCAVAEYMDMMVEVVEAMGCEHIGNGPGCCGKNSRKVGPVLMAERQEEAADADLIVVGCAMCQDKYDSWKDGKPVVHLAELVALAFGDTESLKRHRIPVPLP